MKNLQGWGCLPELATARKVPGAQVELDWHLWILERGGLILAPANLCHGREQALESTLPFFSSYLLSA